MPEAGDTRSNSDPTEAETVTEFDSADAFSLLGDETRLKTLTVLGDPSTETPMEFSELYQQIDTEFTSGFSYHLNKLVPIFVSKTEEGYSLTTFGERVARAIVAGTFTNNCDLDWFPVDGTCLACTKRSLQASYVDEDFIVKCSACDERIVTIQVPPHLIRGRDPDEFIHRVSQWIYNWMRMSMSLVKHGICDYCGGAVVSTVIDHVETYDRIDILLRFECTNCGEIRRSTVGALASLHPSVNAFLSQRGVPLQEQLYWEIESVISDVNMDILSEDPWRFQVSFSADGDTCTLTINEEFEVVDISQ